MLEEDSSSKVLAVNFAAGSASFVVCMLLHHCVSKWLMNRLILYRLLPWEMKMEFDSRFVSTIHATLVTGLSLYALQYEHSMWEEKITRPSEIGSITLSISAGYMLCDSVSMPIYWRNFNLLVFLLHHGIAAICFIVAAHRGVLQFFALYRLTSELSTPFLNMAWLCKLFRLSPTSKLTMINSVCLTISFLICRIAVIPFYWYYFIQSALAPGFESAAIELGAVFILWLVSSIILDALNVHWARKIVRGGWKTARQIFAILAGKFQHKE